MRGGESRGQRGKGSDGLSELLGANSLSDARNLAIATGFNLGSGAPWDSRFRLSSFQSKETTMLLRFSMGGVLAILLAVLCVNTTQAQEGRGRGFSGFGGGTSMASLLGNEAVQKELA